MNLYVTQTITIQKLSIGSISNSSVVQIGTSGIIKPLSNLYNTGGFTKPAPLIGNQPKPLPSTIPPEATLVPLAPIQA
jgi:spore germination protein PB